MQSKDGTTQILLQKKLNFVMAKNEVQNINIKGFMTNNTQVNWNAVRKTYGDGDPRVPMVDREYRCLFHWSMSLDKLMQKSSTPFLQFQHKQIFKDYKDTKTMEEVETKYHVIRS